MKLKPLLLTMLCLLLLAAGAVTGMRTAAFARWRSERQAVRAEKLAQAGQPDAARLGAMKALAADRRNVRALRVLLQTLPEGKLDEALLLCSRIADLDPADAKNLRSLAILATRAERFDLAELTLSGIAASGASEADLLELRARLAAARGRMSEAGNFARQLLAQDAGNVAGRLILALAQIQAGDGTAQLAAERELAELSSIEATRLEALRGLRHAAMLRGDSTQALEYAEKVVAGPRAAFADWLARAEISASLDPGRLDALLAELTAKAGSDPRALGLTAAWLRKRGKADRVEEWLRTTEALGKDAVTAQMIRTETLVAQGDWKGLAALLQEADWKQLDFLRNAYLARAARQMGESYTFSGAWRRAVSEAIRERGRAQMLATTIAGWPGWELEHEEFLWRATDHSPQMLVWALPQLLPFYEKRRDTAGLLRVSEAMLKADPESELAQVNTAFCSLLLDSKTGRAEELATKLFEKHPANPLVAATRALSFLKQREPAQAVAAFEKVDASTMDDATVISVYALALAGAGKGDEARKMAARADQTSLLPELARMLREAGLAAPDRLPAAPAAAEVAPDHH